MTEVFETQQPFNDVQQTFDVEFESVSKEFDNFKPEEVEDDE